MTPNVMIRTTSRLLLVGVGISALLLGNPELALGQPAGGREAIRSLNLSRAQQQQLRGVMQDYQSSLEDILTREQRSQLQDLQAQGNMGDPADIAAELNLNQGQANQFAALQDEMADELTAILTPTQIQQAREIGLPGL
jgi:Spy/CpxP family protein refolding chaperone